MIPKLYGKKEICDRYRAWGVRHCCRVSGVVPLPSAAGEQYRALSEKFCIRMGW